jgi:two-component system chemotaxis response regulator CheB
MATTRIESAPGGVVVVGASAGGVEALTQLVAGLPDDLPYAIAVVLHMPPNAPSVLAKILDRNGPLRAVSASNGAALQAGVIQVGVPDRHFLVNEKHAELTEGPTENSYRPAINALFRSAALSFGPRAIGVVLSGVLDDGVLGAAAVRSMGGTTIVQNPDDALYPTMPLNAIRARVVDHQAAARDIGPLLAKLANREVEERPMERDESMEIENRIAMGARFSTSFEAEGLGPHSGYTCPDCNGSLMAVTEGNYRCRVGHAWTAEALLNARDHEIEGALWIALRSLREKANLSRKMAGNVGSGALFNRYSEVADEADRAVAILGKRLSEATSGMGDRGGG